jgi:hypothetical protein
MNAPSRRQLLAGAGLALAGGTAVAAVPAVVPDATGADAELLATCGRFFEAERAVQAFEDAGGGPDEICNALVKERRDAHLAVAPLRATTPAGIRAKLEVAYLVSRTMEHCVIGDQEWLAFSAIADLLGRPVVPNPGYGRPSGWLMVPDWREPFWSAGA